MQRSGFTLVELLVAVTLIVLLIALLAPALDRAMYDAELTLCASRQDAIASGLTAYAAGQRRAYPYRRALAEGTRLRRPELITSQEGMDDRAILRSMFGNLNRTLLDPLAGKVDMEHAYPPLDTYANYGIWAGIRLATARGGKGLLRLGDRWEWTDDSRGQSSAARSAFTTLVSDFDLVYQRYDGSAVVWTSHPDGDEGVLWFIRIQASTPTPVNPANIRSQGGVYSGWISTTNHRRGELDNNFAFTDGSVERFRRVKWDDEEMARVPYVDGLWDPTIIWRHVPRR